MDLGKWDLNTRLNALGLTGIMPFSLTEAALAFVEPRAVCGMESANAEPPPFQSFGAGAGSSRGELHIFGVVSCLCACILFHVLVPGDRNIAYACVTLDRLASCFGFNGGGHQSMNSCHMVFVMHLRFKSEGDISSLL